MKFAVSSSELYKKLKIAAGAIGTNAVLPILDNFLLSLKGNELTFSATDLETSVRGVITVDGKQDGAATVPAKIIMDTLKALPEQPVTISSQDQKIEILSSNGKYKAAGMEPKDFPAFPAQAKNSMAIKGSLITDGFDKTMFATGSDELRLAMTGVHVTMDESDIIFTATDAHRLVRYTFQTGSNLSGNFILPKKACHLVSTFLTDEDVFISFNKQNCFFSFNEITIATRLIDAKYPDVNAVIPKDLTNIFTVDRSELIHSLKRMGFYAQKATNKVTFDLTSENINLTSQDADYSSEANESIKCEYIGDPLSISFNVKYLSEILGALTTKEISFKLSDGKRAVIVIPQEEEEGTELIMLLMPLAQ